MLELVALHMDGDPNLDNLVGVKVLCCGGTHDANDKVNTVSIAGKDYLAFEAFDGRTEMVSERLSVEIDLSIEFEFVISSNVRGWGVVAQIIGWQPPCFSGGNYQLVFKDGALIMGVNNIRDEKIKVELGPVVYDSPIGVEIDYFASESNGYFIVRYSQGDLLSEITVLEREATYIDCPLGPYFKFGPYGSFENGDLILLRGVSINVED